MRLTSKKMPNANRPLSGRLPLPVRLVSAAFIVMLTILGAPVTGAVIEDEDRDGVPDL